VSGMDMAGVQPDIRLTDGADQDFIMLVAQLDEDLSSRYGEMQKQYTPLNSLAAIKDAAVAYLDGAPVACGAFKAVSEDTVEIKRVFVKPEFRNRGLAGKILKTLENAAKNRGYMYAVLETGVKQHEAIGLYKKSGYAITDKYGPYVGNENSVCMKKAL
jgi:putative acetyltransferase